MNPDPLHVEEPSEPEVLRPAWLLVLTVAVAILFILVAASLVAVVRSR